MENDNPALRITIIVVAILLAVGGGALVWYQTQNAPPIPAPAGYTPYVAADRSFTCQAPQGWRQSSASGQAIAAEATFRKGDAKIDITSDLQGSLMGDIAASGNQMLSGLPGVEGLPGSARKPPVERLHEAGKKDMEERFSHYSEMEMQKMSSGLGDGRFSEFTADGGFMKGKIHGYRVTILGGERRITVLSQCPERDWPRLRDAFRMVIGSLSQGTG